MSNEALRAQPKQQRGQDRIDVILNAASEVFAEVGYENAAIVAIAARAKTSVGSLYQFFANKEAILKVLVERYVERASVVFGAMNIEGYASMSLEESIKATLIPLKAFLRDNRDFQVIFASSIGSSFLTEAIRVMDDAVLARNDAALAIARPDLSAKDRRKYALVCMMIMKALLTLAGTSGELTLDEVFEELEAVYIRYLMPVMLNS